MAARDNLHSRVVAWLKILLPLTALAILSTLFLVARGIEAPDSLPFAERDLKERARNQQITAPNFAGATEAGDLISITAGSAQPDTDAPGRLRAQALAARIDFASGRVLGFRADDGAIDPAADEALLTGGVVVTSSDGFRFETEDLTAGLETVRARSAGEVRGTGPIGRFTAGRMELDGGPAPGGAQLVFTGGVKVVYDPRNPKD